ncbi:hypothetical protein Bca4012_084994 [Brassica carinata]
MVRPGLDQPNQAPPQGYGNNTADIQPNIPTGIPVNNQTQNRWNSDLFDCMNDNENAVTTCIVPCVTFGQIAEIVDEGATTCAIGGVLYGAIYLTAFPFVYSSLFRAKIRNKYGLPDAPAPDWLTHLFCQHCALCQEYRELKYRGFDPKIGWAMNVQAQQQEVMAPPTGQQMMVAAKTPPVAAHIVSRRRDLVSLRIRASKNGSSDYCFHQKLKSFAKSAILIGAAVSMTGKFSTLPAKAESPVTTITEEVKEENVSSEIEPTSPLSELLESTPEAVKTLRSLLQQKLENGEDEEALKLLERLVNAQPDETEWKFLMARLLGEMGRTENARQVFEEILQRNPLSFEALFENALLMDRSGEGDAVLQRLEDALAVAEAENMVKEIRDVRLIIAQIQFLQKNVDEALKSYEQLTREDPKDFRPYFCRGMIYSLLDKNVEAKEQFAKYRELSPKKFEVEGYLRTPLSKMKLFGSGGDN